MAWLRMVMRELVAVLVEWMAGRGDLGGLLKAWGEIALGWVVVD